MKTGFKNNRFDSRSTGKRFGGAGAPWKRKSFDRGGRPRGDMHEAICSECGDSCMVPFVPNGTKPVKCTKCFKRNDDSFTPRPRTPGAFGRGGSSFNTFDRRPSAPAADTSKMEARLKSIEAKLDALIEALSEAGEE